jgi:hypothetical protein
MFSRCRMLLVGAFSLFALPAAAQQQIGTAHGVTPAAHGSVAGTLASGAGVHADETIGTDKAGKAGLRFHDQSNLDIGPNSSVKLNKFIYDPNRSGGKAVLDAAFRFSTGAQGGNRNYQLKTPYGTLGIRG